eukprot:Protomagalhaensia_sp_Gyna_25__4783@NODE_481_length_3309_cov_99_125382_g373_i0_p1_GENE_NODE_481_length_3309_cov_99_125382_g373_i0NODE_481_length_3309_cov_99_125382_g373_i0_p1_ORF_typecomplete_len634_score82_46TPR_19/PF14559_6/0_014TPR_19/PF14559_6/5_1e05TPR_16/PF13432_6/8_1TPR_16/PF13432_6/9_2e05ANAPC3/PF12895_7/24ANAPC3/PF12895_7/0_0022TPR_14/PF13428_6/15TPR_14/PF13428_6/0_0015TPR_15/PF13429_6/6_7TPR_15/PF13429_6/0_028TPR_2/PF07719_17/0_00034TPR_11/PF13414_6/0_0025TAtT/PF16811_5/1_8e03TAtT/PF168
MLPASILNTYLSLRTLMSFGFWFTPCCKWVILESACSTLQATAHARHLLRPEAQFRHMLADVFHILGAALILESQFADPMRLPEERLVPWRQAEKYLEAAHQQKPHDGRISLTLAQCRLLIFEASGTGFTVPTSGTEATRAWVTPEIADDFLCAGLTMPTGVPVSRLLLSAKFCCEHAFRMRGGGTPLSAALLVLTTLRSVTVEREMSVWWSQARENPEYAKAFAFLRFNASEAGSGSQMLCTESKRVAVAPASQINAVASLQVLCAWLYHLCSGLWSYGQQQIASPFSDGEESRLNNMLGLSAKKYSVVDSAITAIQGEIASWVETLMLASFGASVTAEATFPLSNAQGLPTPPLLRLQRPSLIGQELLPAITAADAFTGALQAADDVANHWLSAASPVSIWTAHRTPRKPGFSRCSIPWVLRARQQTRTLRSEAEAFDPNEEPESFSVLPSSPSDLLPADVILLACLEAAHSSRQRLLADNVFHTYTRIQAELAPNSKALVNYHMVESNHKLILGLHAFWLSNYAEAEEHLTQALALNPANCRARILLARTFFVDEQNRDIALVRLDHCTQLFPSSQVSKFLQGTLLMHVFNNHPDQRNVGAKLLRQYARGCPIGNMNIVDDLSQIVSIEV